MPTWGGGQADAFVTATISTQSAPRTRTRSIWLTQLSLAAAVVAIILSVYAFEPSKLSAWTFISGVAVIFAMTVLALILPWNRLPTNAVLLLPFGDIVGIGLWVLDADLRFGLLWVFPVVWIATYFAIPYLIAALAGITLWLLVQAMTLGLGDTLALRIVTIVLCLSFIGLSTVMTARQTRAFKQLLRGQAYRLQRTVERVRAQERRVTQLLGAIDVGIIQFSSTGEVLDVNDAYFALYDVHDGNLDSSTLVEYDRARRRMLADHERPIRRVAQGELIDEERVWLRAEDESWRTLSISSRPIADSGDGTPGMLLLARDVTDLIVAEQAREQLLAMVSHELRNPLTVIIGNAELVADDVRLPDETRKRVGVIEAASERMHRLLDEVLETHRSKPEELAPARVDLREVIAPSITSFDPVARSNGVTVTYTPLDQPVIITGNALRLRQVFDNLISNATKYTPSGGTVHVSAQADDDSIAIRIADTGIGIDAADMARIFEPYFRAEPARSHAAGTGLGLNITRDIVREHGGELSIDSMPGKGTTMTVRLPLAAALVHSTEGTS